ncbi:MAG: DHA2 family efflux MFS transporter permease subunit [Bryobacteraceae bacterium]
MAATLMGAGAAAVRKHGINPWVIAGTVMLATFMEVLDTSVANVALPHIAGSLGATTDESTWVLTAYLVANAIILPMSGWFSMIFGRKRFYMTCVFLFTVSSMLCGMAPSLFMLILFRVMQGVGGGALQPVSQAILREVFPREKQGMAMAMFGIGVVFAPVIGPTLGGWITDNWSWRWIFFINIPVGVLSLLLTSMLVHDPPWLVRRSLKQGHIDFMGLGLLTVGLGALEIMLDEGQRKDWFGSDLIVQAAALAAICLTAVVFWELRHVHPVVDFRLLKDRNFAISTFSMFSLGFVLYGSTVLLPLYMQELLGYTATQSGMALSPGGIVIMMFMPLVGFLINRVQPRWLVVFGLSMAALGLWMMSGFTLGVDFPHIITARIVQSIGLAFLFVPINTMAFYYIARERLSYATGIINLARNIGGSCGIAFAMTMLARRAQYHQSVLAAHVTSLDSGIGQQLRGMTQVLHQQGFSMADAAVRAQAMLYGLVQRQAAALAFMDGFWALALIFVGLIPFMFMMRGTVARGK